MTAEEFGFKLYQHLVPSDKDEWFERSDNLGQIGGFEIARQRLPISRQETNVGTMCFIKLSANRVISAIAIRERSETEWRYVWLNEPDEHEQAELRLIL